MPINSEMFIGVHKITDNAIHYCIVRFFSYIIFEC